MADVITAQDAGRLLTLVAPGYFAYAGYTQRFPRRAREEFPVLVTSVALSLPLVTAANETADGLGISTAPSHLGYVALLLGLSAGAGFVFGLLRASNWFRKLLRKIGLNQEPEIDVLARTVMRLPKLESRVTVSFKDGARLSGTPKFYNEDPEAERRELYVDHSRWWDGKEGKWRPQRASGGVMVYLDEVRDIEMEDDPS